MRAMSTLLLNPVAALATLAMTAAVPLPAHASLNVICQQGQNPLGAFDWLSNPTVFCRSQWDRIDEADFSIIWMNSLAYGPGCAGACTLVPWESAFAPVSAFVRPGSSTRVRYQVLTTNVSGQYTMNAEAQGFIQHPTYGRQSSTSLRLHSVTGTVVKFPGGLGTLK